MRDASTSPLCIGIDDGYAFTKIALPSGRVLAVPSRARLGVAGERVLSPGRHQAERIHFPEDRQLAHSGATCGRQAARGDCVP